MHRTMIAILYFLCAVIFVGWLLVITCDLVSSAVDAELTKQEMQVVEVLSR